MCSFNPRSHTGSDYEAAREAYLLGVSIHAPTRGATTGYVWNSDDLMFQSTLPHGERLLGGISGAISGKFQSTLPHGERPCARRHAGGQGGFNPRSHTGSDCGLPKHIKRQIVSIHAPTRGATREDALTALQSMFQSTLPHGERPNGFSPFPTSTCFNPRSHTGSDPAEGKKTQQAQKFQSTLPHGERQKQITLKPTKQCFNPRSHTGSDLNI